MEFTFNVKIDAPTSEKAREAIQAMIDLKKSMSHEDLLLFAKKVKEKPGLIQTAKKWL
ncbi:MAG: hypothetical protein HY840_07850 [Bacteroidetes bacterium]|nr:hypothetical protein [Bacteroidota bacterium]